MIFWILNCISFLKYYFTSNNTFFMLVSHSRNLRNHIIPKLSLSNQYINRKHSSMVSCLVIEHSEEKLYSFIRVWCLIFYSMLSGDSNGDICLFDLDDFGVAPFQSITYKNKSSYRQNKMYIILWIVFLFLVGTGRSVPLCAGTQLIMGSSFHPQEIRRSKYDAFDSNQLSRFGIQKILN